MRPRITLATDFGMRDPYVAAMKGVILSRCPDADIIDLSHEITPGSILEGALFLAGSFPYFPKATIHVVVVDPGVGTKRTPIVAQFDGQLVVCPDNGLITLLSHLHPLEWARAISNPAFMRSEVSATFHGRDVFAPAAARLASGAAFEEIGDPMDSIQMLRVPQAKKDTDGNIGGQIIHVDHFGNCVTNVHESLLGDNSHIRVEAGTVRLKHLSRTYSDASAEEPLCLIGSTGYLEIAINQGSAQQMYGLGLGDAVRVNVT